MSPLLKDFPVCTSLPIAWGEMDAMGHVNNMLYFRYFESARIAYFERMRFLELMQENQIGPILKETSCRFRIPLTYPAQIEVGARVKTIQEFGFVHQYQIVTLFQNEWKIVAEGEGNIVAFDYAKKQKIPLPEMMWKRIEELEQKTFIRA